MDIESKTYEAKSEDGWGFKFYIEKAIPSGDEENMVIMGVASTLNVDHDGERMALPALQSMANIINEKSVPLRIEHQKDDQAIVGSVNKAWIDDRKQLWISASLNKNHPAASILFGSLKSGAKLGLSVGGRVKSAIRELVESVGKQVKTFYNVALEEVSVTTRPANFDSWLTTKLQKSISSDDIEKSRETGLFTEFLFENPQLDYLRAIEKSVPANEFHEVEVEPIKSKTSKAMKKEEKTDSEETKETKESEKAMDTSEKEEETKTTKAEETSEEKESEKTKSEKDKESETETETTKSQLKELTKAMVALTGVVAKMSESTKEDKETDETKSQGEVALDQANPDEKKSEDEGQQKAKTQKKEEDKDSETDTYELKSIKDCIKRIGKLSKAMDETTHSEDDTKTKNTKSEKEEETTTKSMSSIDEFALGLTTFLEQIQDRVEKSGKNIPGLAEALVDVIKNDPQIQKSIAGYMREPGIKKSVAFNTPYMVDKTGKRYALSAKAVDTVEKSEKPGNFNDLWKTELSPSRDAE